MQVKLDLESDRVKGVSFHPIRPLVAYSTHTGSVHVYDYEIGSELSCYNVTGDNSPVRCVSFHPTQPLFACGTDHCDVIVYNWQRKMRLFSLTGHLDYVRSVEFHSMYPLLLSTSDDSTVRIWNWQSRCCVSILEDHTYFVMCARFNPQKPLIATASLDDCVRLFNVAALFNSSMSTNVDNSFLAPSNEGTLTFEAEEHAEGADSVAWDASGNKLYSCGEDSTIKVFNVFNDTPSLANVITVNNGPVTSVAVHCPSSMLVAASEDSSVRFFDGATNQQILKYEVPASRFWCVACHPKDALIAAGHDRGLVILKFRKERPPFDVQGNSVLWLQGNELHFIDLMTKATNPAIQIDNIKIKNLSWNSSRSLALISFSDRDGNSIHNTIDMKSNHKTNDEEGGYSTWLSRSTMISLASTQDKLLMKEFGGAGTIRSIAIPRCSRIFAGTQQRVYLATRTSIILFDVVRSQTISEIKFSNAKSIVFDDKREYLCARNSNSIITAKADLSEFSIHNDSNKIKSCCFCGNSVLYTTRNHLKYIVKSTSGVICSLPRVLYIVKAAEKTAWFITRDGVVFKRDIDTNEVKLKVALIQNKSEDVAKRIIRETPPVGQAIMEFAADHKRYDIACSLARDSKTKFELSLKSGDYKTAIAAADELNDPASYKKLSQSLINAGLFGMAESSMKKAKDYESLSFLYLISGESEKLAKLSKHTQSLEHLLWANDEASIRKIFQNAAPNLDLGEELESTLKISPGAPMLSDWPTTMTSSNMYDSNEQIDNIDDEEATGWSDDDLGLIDENGEITEKKKQNNEDDEDGWNIDIDINDSEIKEYQDALGASYIPPTPGESVRDKWAENSQTAGDFVAAGRFSEALSILQETIALRNAQPLRNVFIETYVSVNMSVPSLFFTSFSAAISTTFRNQICPSINSPIPLIDELTKVALSAFSRGKFVECRQACTDIMHHVAVAVVSTREEEQKLLDSLETAKTYYLAVTLEMTRKSEPEGARHIELATYLTYLKLIPSHIRLVLQSAMRVLTKGGNFLTCKIICQRLLDMGPNEKVAKQAQQILMICNQKASNRYEIDFDERNPFVVCAMTMKPIYRGKPTSQCPFCKAHFIAQCKGKLCPICEMCEIGAQCSGLKLLRYGK